MLAGWLAGSEPGRSNLSCVCAVQIVSGGTYSWLISIMSEFTHSVLQIGKLDSKAEIKYLYFYAFVTLAILTLFALNTLPAEEED